MNQTNRTNWISLSLQLQYPVKVKESLEFRSVYGETVRQATEAYFGTLDVPASVELYISAVVFNIGEAIEGGLRLLFYR